MKLKDSIWTLKKLFCELFWLKLLFYIFSKCSDSLVLRKKKTNNNESKNKTNVQTDCMYKHMVFREENSSVSFITLLFAFLILIICYTDEITSVLRNSNLPSMIPSISYGNIYRNIECSIIAVNIFSNVATFIFCMDHQRKRFIVSINQNICENRTVWLVMRFILLKVIY